MITDCIFLKTVFVHVWLYTVMNCYYFVYLWSLNFFQPWLIGTGYLTVLWVINNNYLWNTRWKSRLSFPSENRRLYINRSSTCDGYYLYVYIYINSLVIYITRNLYVQWLLWDVFLWWHFWRWRVRSDGSAENAYERKRIRLLLLSKKKFLFSNPLDRFVGRPFSFRAYCLHSFDGVSSSL